MTIPDALSPQQYYGGIRSDDASARPVKRLMLAVLEDAMRCYQTYANSRNGTQRRLFVDAEAWLMDRRADGPFAFETVCETLGIEPSCLREGPAPMARAAIGWAETVPAGASITSDAHRPDKRTVEPPPANSDDGERSRSTAVASPTTATAQAIAITTSPAHNGDHHHGETAGNSADAGVSARIEVQEIAVN